MGHGCTVVAVPARVVAVIAGYVVVTAAARYAENS
jgi:hypothetical protein